MTIKKRVYKCDVAIIGGGIAGIVTAFELLEHNKKVIVLDRDSESKFGGQARESFGGMMIIDSPQQRKMGLKDNPDLALSDWLRVARFNGEDFWPRKWAETYVNNSIELIYDWLVKRQIKFLPVVNWAERGLFEPANTVPRWLITWGTGHHLMTMIIKHLDEHPNRKNLQIYFNHRVSTIDYKNKRVSECSGTIEGTKEAFVVKTDCIVAASGGILGGDLSKARRHWHEKWKKPSATLLNGSHRYADGLIHDCISGIGGNVTYLDRQWNYASGIHHPHPDRHKQGLSLVPPRSALWVDAFGKRIGPVPLMANTDTGYIVDTINKQPGQYSWQILNWKIAIKELAVSGCEYMKAFRNRSKIRLIIEFLFGNKELANRLIRESKDFVTADSIGELTQKMNQLDNEFNVDGELLESEIKTYDEQIDRGPRFFNDDQLRRIANFRSYRGDRMRICNFQKINDPKAKPLIAIREFIMTRKSLGGVQTDLQSRVLNNSGDSIPGLYAVGETAGYGGGGIHGEGCLEGTFLTSSILTARIAAKAISGKTL